MPTYEYACRECSNRFETWQKMTDDPLTTCPECGGSIRRVLFPAGVVFKGSGFYKTDHGDSSSKVSENGNSQKSEKSKEGETKTAGESKSSESSSEKSSTKTS